jgi:hypothetical protein
MAALGYPLAWSLLANAAANHSLKSLDVSRDIFSF